MSKTAVLFNYNHSDSYGTQDSISSQLSAPRTIESYVSEQMHFTMSSNGPLDPKEKNSPFGDRPRLASPDDGGVVWTVGPAASNDIIDYDEAPKSPHVSSSEFVYCTRKMLIASLGETEVFHCVSSEPVGRMRNFESSLSDGSKTVRFVYVPQIDQAREDLSNQNVRLRFCFR